MGNLRLSLLIETGVCLTAKFEIESEISRQGLV